MSEPQAGMDAWKWFSKPDTNPGRERMNDITLDTFGRLGISLLVGMLVGLQREKTDSTLAGFRTFALIATGGTLAALLDSHLGANGWIVAAGLIAVVGVIIVSEWRLGRQQSQQVGMTTAIAIIVVFCVGAYLVHGEMVVAVAIGVGVAALLQFKPELHSIAGQLGEQDMRAIIQFAVFSCVILPVLPNENMGPLNVFNPFNIWLMVVLIVGISLAGYIVYKFFGQSAGVVAGGLLGGAISSTATSFSYSKRSRDQKSMANVSAAVIVIASSVVFVRVLIELAVVAPSHLRSLGIPILFLLGSCIMASAVAWIMFRGNTEGLPEPSNPTEFKSALLFGGLYALVLWGLAAAKVHLGSEALYIVAILSGLTDMDAITLSTGRMVEQSSRQLDADIGWRLLVTASISNLMFKSGIVAIVGGRALFWRVFLPFLLPTGCGLLLLLLWK